MKRLTLTIGTVLLVLVIVFVTQFSQAMLTFPTNRYHFHGTVVFYPQHQDDEILWAGSAIIRAVDDVGAKNVYVVLVSSGSGSKIFTRKEFAGMTETQKVGTRMRDFKASLRDLGVLPQNISLLAAEKLPTGLKYKLRSENQNLEDPPFHYGPIEFVLMRKKALEFEEKYSDVTHVAHTYDRRLEWHPQHLKNGRTIKDLYDQKLISNCLFFVKPPYRFKIKQENRVTFATKTKREEQMIDNAIDEYEKIDHTKGRYGLGYLSDNKSFDALRGNPENTSYLHTPAQ